jgi:F-box protein, helicase, 18
MQLTPEQQAIINSNGNLVVNAVAGSGKTSTLIAYAKSRPLNSKILYIAFNKTVKVEAQEKFAKAGIANVTVETAHSLAFNYVVKHSQYKVGNGYKSYELAKLLQIDTGENNVDIIIANHVTKFIAFFCNSSIAKVQALDYRAVITEPKAKQFVHNFYDSIEKFTREALAKMQKGEIDITHDFYLKLFQLSKPSLPYQYILFDEGQDASAAMLDVFLHQKATKIIVGDIHQQIYGWRFAINSLQQVDFPVYHLTHSFRFDEEVALVANKVLAWKHKHLQNNLPVKVIGNSVGSTNTFTKATIGRTNLALLLHAIAQVQNGNYKKIYFEGNINSYTFADEGASLYDVLHLYNGNTSKIKDALIASMPTLKELEEYIEKTEDNSLGMIVEVVKEFGNKLPDLIANLKNNHTANKADAEMIFTTVHRCKGMEYDEVYLLKDFITENKLQQLLLKMDDDTLNKALKNKLEEEVNILYVAITRAVKKLYIPAEINPLQSIEITTGNNITLLNTRNYTNKKDDWDLYSKTEAKKSTNNIATLKNNKPHNQGKSWKPEEVEKLEQLFYNHESFSTIAEMLGRSEKSIQIKLIGLGLLAQDDEY